MELLDPSPLNISPNVLCLQFSSTQLMATPSFQVFRWNLAIIPDSLSLFYTSTPIHSDIPLVLTIYIAIIWLFVTTSTAHTLVQFMNMSCLDYCNFLLSLFSAKVTGQIPLTHNSVDVISLLKTLLWLPVLLRGRAKCLLRHPGPRPTLLLIFQSVSLLTLLQPDRPSCCSWNSQTCAPALRSLQWLFPEIGLTNSFSWSKSLLNSTSSPDLKF